MTEWGLDYMATNITYNPPKSSGGGNGVKWPGTRAFWNQTDQVLSLGCVSFFMGDLTKRTMVSIYHLQLAVKVN